MNNHYKNFKPDFGLRLQANLILNRIIDAAPFGASAIGVLEVMADGHYRCSLNLVEEQLMSLIADRKSRRGGPMPPSTPPVLYPALRRPEVSLGQNFPNEAS